MNRRRSIVELAWYVCAGGRGAPDHPVARAVVEGRDYSTGPGTSCVELVDCVAFAAGCRAGAINRDEHRGRNPQRDLGWYLDGSDHQGTIIHRPQLDQLKPGDFLGYDFDRGGHACVYLGRMADRAITADYGQPGGGGRIYECSVVETSWGFTCLRNRALWAAVDVDTLVYPEPALSVREWCLGHGLADPGPVQPAEYLADE